MMKRKLFTENEEKNKKVKTQENVVHVGIGHEYSTITEALQAKIMENLKIFVHKGLVHLLFIFKGIYHESLTLNVSGTKLFGFEKDSVIIESDQK
jgi:pectin methylesterase-like acyl-CoA thioesterase